MGGGCPVIVVPGAGVCICILLLSMKCVSSAGRRRLAFLPYKTSSYIRRSVYVLKSGVDWEERWCLTQSAEG